MLIPSENNVYGFINTLSKTRMVLDAKKPMGNKTLFTSHRCFAQVQTRVQIWKADERVVSPTREMIHLLLENCDQNRVGIKKPTQKTQKNHLKNPLKMDFFVFFLF